MPDTKYSRNMKKQPDQDGLGSMNPETEVQAPQCPEDQHGPDYDNDVPANSWLRNDGTKKPGFDRQKGGR